MSTTRIVRTLVPDATMFVVYDADGNRRGAFDRHADAAAFAAALPVAEPTCEWCGEPERDDEAGPLDVRGPDAEWFHEGCWTSCQASHEQAARLGTVVE